MGTLSFVFGFFITLALIANKVYYNWYLHKTVRSVTDQPLFFLALIAVVVGVQLFLAGFLGEMVTTSNPTKSNEYLISDKVGL
jgi:hypothetical protein